MTQRRLNPPSLMLLNMKYYIPYYLIALAIINFEGNFARKYFVKMREKIYTVL